MVSTLIVDEATLSDTLIAHLATPLAPFAAFDTDDLQRFTEAGRPQVYVELLVTRRDADAPRRVAEWQGANSYRILTRFVADSLHNARNLRRLTRAAFDANMVTCLGSTAPVTFEADDTIGQDDGAWVGTTTWTCTF